MSWSADGDFVLTEFRLEALNDTHTNIARGARGKASHLLSGNMTPAAGNYTLEAKAVHSDGQFDASIFSLPVKVLAPFAQTPAFYALSAVSCLTAGAILMLRLNRRKIARLEAESALALERRRIARDMHDDVGARLSQLSVLQDTFARDYQFPAEAREDLRQLTLTARQAVHAVSVADNGVGLARTPPDTGGDGIGNMRNRLASIKGSCAVRSRPQGGTEVVFRIPLTFPKRPLPPP